MTGTGCTLSTTIYYIPSITAVREHQLVKCKAKEVIDGFVSSHRSRAFDDMYYLIDNYAPFAVGEGPSRLDESQRVAFPTEADHTATKFGSAESSAYAAKMREGVSA